MVANVFFGSICLSTLGGDTYVTHSCSRNRALINIKNAYCPINICSIDFYFVGRIVLLTFSLIGQIVLLILQSLVNCPINFELGWSADLSNS